MRFSCCPPPSRPAIPALLATTSLAAVLSLGLLSGCSGFSSDEKPLPDSTFTTMLTELHLAKARIMVEDSVPVDLRDSVFARHGVDSTAFYATLNYYSRRPKAFEAVYSSVIDTLQSVQYPGDERPMPQEGSRRDSLYRDKRGMDDSP
ncbi:MAG: DUF4296 domain-containing protein [Bacteroidetes bacterium QH_9_64_21]|nr:MAG: DUF4296 domain-containing protein [Bacteroidetes bacterium QH_9_64_21]